MTGLDVICCIGGGRGMEEIWCSCTSWLGVRGLGVTLRKNVTARFIKWRFRFLEREEISSLYGAFFKAFSPSERRLLPV